MTMHLMGHAYTTTNTRKRKAKDTQRSQREREAAWHEHNRFLRQHGRPRISFSEYLDEISGKKYKPKKFEPLQRDNNVYRRGDTSHIPSKGDGVGTAVAPERKEYTGDLIAGIATMHKSNAVPVMRGTDEARDIARMRRG